MPQINMKTSTRDLILQFFIWIGSYQNKQKTTVEVKALITLLIFTSSRFEECLQFFIPSKCPDVICNCNKNLIYFNDIVFIPY